MRIFRNKIDFVGFLNGVLKIYQRKRDDASREEGKLYIDDDGDGWRDDDVDKLRRVWVVLLVQVACDYVEV